MRLSRAWPFIFQQLAYGGNIRGRPKPPFHMQQPPRRCYLIPRHQDPTKNCHGDLGILRGSRTYIFFPFSYPRILLRTSDSLSRSKQTSSKVLVSPTPLHFFSYLPSFPPAPRILMTPKKRVYLLILSVGNDFSHLDKARFAQFPFVQQAARSFCLVPEIPQGVKQSLSTQIQSRKCV